MKKICKFSLAAFAAASLFFACSKAEVAPSESIVNPSDEQAEPAVDPGVPGVVTISASLEDLTTKVGFAPVYDTDGKTTQLTTTWSEGDKIRVYNHADRTQFEDFTLNPACAGQKSGTFTGTAVAGSSFDLEIVNGDINYASQTQPADGVTTDLKYLASISDVADYTHISFTEFSSVLAISCKLPSTEVAASIKSIDFTASEAIFNSGKTLTITLTETGDADEDGILNLFATLPKGSTNVPAGTEMMVRFNAPDSDHKVYSRLFTMGATTFSPEKVNTLNVNASESDRHAGRCDGTYACDGSTAEKAYLIADGYQLAAVNSLATGGQTTYFKLIDDVNMTGITHNQINTNSGYSQAVDFNGNNKTISYLGSNLFYVFKGSAYDLTLDHSTVTNRGIFAEYCQGTGHTITNVNISNGSVTSKSDNAGALIGRINNGSETCATITNCTVSSTTVNGAGNVGGVIGQADALVVVSGSSFIGTSVTGSGQYVGGFVGQIRNYASTFTDCHVEEATINANSTAEARAGGFAGLLYTNATIKGCTVGTSDQKVVVNTKEPAIKEGTTYNVINAGGFVGVNYGTITKNGDNRSKAYVQITSTNAQGTPLNLGGFAGYLSGTIEYSDAVVDMSTLKGQYIGGFVGITAADGAVIDHCSVDGSVKGNNYTGMFIGTAPYAVTITNNTAAGTVNGQSSVGGFVGYCNNNPTFTNNTTSATTQSNGSNVGGFVGAVEVATISGCSATGKVEKLSGTYNVYGGFAGYVSKGTLDGCYSTGKVDADAAQTEYVGGFCGHVNPATGNQVEITNCYSESDVEGSGRWTAGFIGYIYKSQSNCGDVVISKCHATGDVSVSANKNYVAGFLGRTYMIAGSHVTIEKCYATGNVTSNSQYISAFIGELGEATDATISDCYSTGNIIGTNQIRGGLVGAVNANASTSATISRCYSTCSMNDGSFRLGGLIGNIATTKCTMEDCAAWNGAIVATAYAYNTNWSSGTIVGTAHPNCHLSNNYRNPDMTMTMWWVPDADYDHPDVDGTTHPLVIRNNETPYTYTEATVTTMGSPYQFPYHGKHVASETTLSQLASTSLGWDADVWDFSGALPTLK